MLQFFLTTFFKSPLPFRNFPKIHPFLIRQPSLRRDRHNFQCLIAFNKVGEEEFEKLSNMPVWSVCDLSDFLFDKFVLFFKLEAEMQSSAVSKQSKDRNDQGLGKPTALEEKSGEEVKSETSKEQSECKERADLAPDVSVEVRSSAMLRLKEALFSSFLF